MSRLPSRSSFGPRSLTRRELLARSARGATGLALAPGLLALCQQRALANAIGAASPGKRLVLLWLEGGPSQIDTFDPKPGSPTHGSFGTIPTEVAGWSMCEHLPKLAARAGELSVVRTVTSREGNHSRARALMHTGYTPSAAVPFPTLGSIVANEIGDLNYDLPAFVQVGGPTASSGYLPLESGPFRVEDPSAKIENLDHPQGVGPARMDRRDKMRSVFDAQFRRQGGEAAAHADDVQRIRARRMMDSKLRSAFALDEEKEAVRDAYGRTPFGQGVLLARRLIESGVTAVEVVLDGWDTHKDNFTRTQDLCRQLDPAFARLMDDLKERGLDDETLVLCMGEFGRTPEIQSSNGRGHWPNNYCAVLGGAGIRKGTVVGTTDERGESIVERPVYVSDLFATVADALGIDGEKTMESGVRPVSLVDPEGVPVRELLA